MATGNLGRIQWSKQGISLYDVDGSFVTRIEDKEYVRFLTNWMQRGLLELQGEMERRAQEGVEASGNAESEEAHVIQ